MAEASTPMSQILDESPLVGDFNWKKYTAVSVDRDELMMGLEGDDDDEKHKRKCTDNVFRIEDPEAKHRLKMLIQGEEHVPQVRNILNWPTSLSYRLKSLLSAILSPSFMMQCLKLPTFAFYSLEALIFLGIVLLPVFVLESVFYPLCRLIFGVLYPAYSSYKAIRSREIKKYVRASDASGLSGGINHSQISLAGEMDDVLDRVRLFHVHRNVHGHLSVLVPVLLRGEGDSGHLAVVAGHQRQLHYLPEVRASHVDAQRDRKYRLNITYYFNYAGQFANCCRIIYVSRRSTSTCRRPRRRATRRCLSWARKV